MVPSVKYASLGWPEIDLSDVIVTQSLFLNGNWM